MKVAICIPNYNMASSIEETIKSVLNQTYTKCDMYILDNASIDNSWEIIKKYKNKYKSIKIFRNDYTLSMEENWNKILKLAHDADYINILSADDILHQTYVEDCLRLHKKYNNKLGYVYSERRNISNGKVSPYRDFYDSSALINFIDEFLVNIKGFHTAPCQLLINNNVLKDVGYMSTEFGIASEMHLTLKINSKYDVGYLKKTLVDYNISSGMSKDYDTIKEMSILFYRLKKDIITRYLPKELEKDKKLLFEYVNLFCSKFCLSKIFKLINDSNFEEAKKIFFLAVSFDTRLINSTLFEYIHSNESYDVTHFESEYKLLFPSRLKSYELSKNSIKIKN